MLSALPKLADRNFVLGFFLPSLLFTLATLAVFSDHPLVKRVAEILTAKDIGEAAFLLVGVWVLGVLLLSVNHPLYRFLEGYSWPFSRFKRRREHYRTQLRRGKKELRMLYDRWGTEGDGFPRSDLNRYRDLTRKLTNALPSRESDVMPTSFGNAIKAFEVYPRDVYGADAPPVWLRLVAVVPKTALEQIQEARTQVDFLINCSLLAGVLGAFAFVKSLWLTPWRLFGTSPSAALAFFVACPWLPLAISVLGCLVAWAFYLWAVTRVPAWGELVMAVFDCYLPALAKQLGFALPTKEEKRSVFWTTFSQMIVYRRDPAGLLPFNPESWTAVKAEGPNARVEKAKDESNDNKCETEDSDP